MGCCKTLALVAVAATLILLQLSYFTVKALRIVYLPPIAGESNYSMSRSHPSMSPTNWYEFVVYSTVILLQIVEYTVLFYSLGQSTLDIGNGCLFLKYPRQPGEWAPLDVEINEQIQRSWKNHKLKRSVIILLLAVLFLLAAAIAALAFKRDIQYIDWKASRQRELTIVYEFVIKLGIFTSNAMIRVFVTALYWHYVSEWDERRAGIEGIDVEDTPIKVIPGDDMHPPGTVVADDNGHPPNEHPPGTVVTCDLITRIDIQARVNTYAYNVHYHESGMRTDGIRKALQSWFVMQFLVYLLNIFTDVVSVVKPIFRGDSLQQEWEIWAHSASILYGGVSIFLPYLLALWMVDIHRKYYAEMTNKYLLTNSEAPTPTAKCYVAEVIARKIKLYQEYDFCPQILGVTIPVISPGYAISIFLALFALIAKFIT